jgi:hypothetical protein
MNASDVINEAAIIVDRYLMLVEAEVESKAALKSGRYVCNCRHCLVQRRDTLVWLDAIHTDPPEPRAA